MANKPLVIDSSGRTTELSSGDLALPADPTTSLAAATKQYVDARAVANLVAGTNITIDKTNPLAPVVGLTPTLLSDDSSFTVGSSLVQRGTGTCTASGTHTASTTITFPVAFESTPVVSAQVTSSGSAAGNYLVICVPSNITETGCTLNFNTNSSDGDNGNITSDITFNWTAEGQGTGGGTSPSDYSDVIMQDAPIGYWKCNDASGGFQDYSGNGYHMTTVVGTILYNQIPILKGAPSDLYAVIGGFSGSSLTAAARITSQLGQTYPLLNWSVEGIFVPFNENTNSVRVLDLRPSGLTLSAISEVLWVGNGYGKGSTQVYYPASSQLITAFGGDVGRPNHVVHTCSTSGSVSTICVYINGYLLGTTTCELSTLTGTMIANIGSLPGTSVTPTDPFAVGHCAIYNKALSAARVAAHAHAAGLLG